MPIPAWALSSDLYLHHDLQGLLPKSRWVTGRSLDASEQGMQSAFETPTPHPSPSTDSDGSST